MKIAVFGATGRTGINVIKQALAKNIQVVTLVRNPSKLGDLADKVQAITGDGLNLNDVVKTINGVDAVISVVGPTKDSEPLTQTNITKNIVLAMQQNNIKRLITMTGAGVRTEQDNPKLIDKAIVALMKIVAKKALEDGGMHAKEVKSSDLNWTIVRGPMLNEKPGKGTYKVGMVGDKHLSTKISRQDVAKFIIDILEDESYFGKMPMISD